METRYLNIDHERSIRIIRQAEFSRLLAILDSPPESPGTIDLVGDPGSGKTFLLGALARAAEEAGFVVLEGRCSAAVRGISFAPLIGALAALPDSAPAIEEALAHLTMSGAGDRPLSAGALVPAFRRLFHYWRHAKVLIMLDDFTQIDAGSLELIELLQRCAPGAFALVCAHRVRPAPQFVRRFLHEMLDSDTAVRIELAPFCAARSADLLDMAPEDPELAELHRRAQGNPLYLRTLAELRTAPAFALTETTFGTRLIDEITALDAEQLSVIETAAVFGGSVDIDTLATLAELDPARVCAVATTLIEADLLRRAKRPREIAVRHPLVAELIAARIDPCRRSGLYRRTSDLLRQRGASATVLAGCLENVDVAATRAADLAVFVAAAREAMPADPRAASRWLEIVVRRAAAGSDPDFVARAGVQVALIRARLAGGEADGAAGLLLAEPTRAAGETVATIAFRAVMAAAVGATQLAGELLEAGRVVEPSSSADRLIILMAWGAVDFLRGALPSADRAREIGHLVEHSDDPLHHAMSQALAAFRAVWEGGGGDASRALERSAAIVDQLSDDAFAEQPACLAMLGWAEVLAGRLVGAERHLSRALTLAELSGDLYLRPILRAGLCYTYQDLGRFVEAEHLLVEPSTPDSVDGGYGGLLAALRARNCAITGPDVCAIDDVARASSLWSRESRWTRIATLVLADAAMLTGDAELCAALVLRAGGGVGMSDIPPSLRPCCYQALAAAAAGAAAGVDRWANYAESAAESVPQQHAFAVTAKGHLDRSHGDHAAATTRYQQAAELFSEAKMRGAQVRLLFAAADAAISLGDPDTATSLLSLTKQLARECGATRVYRLASEAGGSLRANHETSTYAAELAALTSREREIAQLIAATGMRTRDAALRLGLSPRTVDTHLTSIYRKLNISSRSALVALVAGKPERAGVTNATTDT
ncbi:AAA family ATPase [Nocardia asteroides]|uniref:AAA family ATPase n=1 Tax=Nocardia asteroides TaxID=1824 RepID=UPI001E5EF92F|nr:LuxR family transcriptional regulator [Nocardia asteroides]UGT55280.1 AAA family ATPase [Nocardia asteroides]